MATKKATKKVTMKDTTITWMDLNRVLRETEDLKSIQVLMNNEKRNRNRGPWLLRIHQRYNQVRREKEQRELLQEV